MKDSVDGFNGLCKLSTRIIERVVGTTLPIGASDQFNRQDLLSMCIAPEFQLKEPLEDSVTLWRDAMDTLYLPEILKRCGQSLFVYVGSNGVVWNSLIERLAGGLCSHGMDTQYSSLDVESLSEIPDYQLVVGVLKANPWLVFLNILAASDWFRGSN